MAEYAEKVVINRNYKMKQENKKKQETNLNDTSEDEEEEDNMNNNNEFCLFLGLLRKKKQFNKEQIPYYIDYNVKQYLYRSETEEAGTKTRDIEADEEFRQNFIKEFLNF